MTVYLHRLEERDASTDPIPRFGRASARCPALAMPFRLLARLREAGTVGGVDGYMLRHE